MQLYQTLLARLARTLDGSGISYMIIGGQAVLVHGEPRLTRNIEDVRGVLVRRPVIDENYLTSWLSTFHEVVHRDLVAEYGMLKSDL